MKTDEERFWAKVKKRPGRNACWMWLGKGRVGWGYGTFSFTGERPATTSNRAAYRIQVGSIPPKKCVLHRCDEPLCVRGPHLFLGTRAENMEDMVRKGRQARGIAKPHAKLNEVKVRSIRRRYTAGESPTLLAKEHDLKLRSLWDVLQRRNWAWVK